MIKICVTRLRVKAVVLAPILAAMPLFAVADFSVSVQPLAPRVVPPAPPAAPPATMPQSAAVISPGVWEITAQDTTAQQALSRWGRSVNWIVLWQGAEEVPLKGQGRLMFPDFLSVADYMIKKAQADGFKIKAKAHSNNVLVISKAE